MATKSATPKIVPLFRGGNLDDEPEVPVSLAPVPVPQATETAASTDLDLSGKPKVLFLLGAGNSGKTLYARWLGSRMHQHGRDATIAALDPQNRSLASWFDGVMTPETSDSAHTARWLRELIGLLIDEKGSALIDLGAGDTSLMRTVAAMPDLVAVMQEAGVEPVAVYLLTPRQDDLASLASLELAGFQPPATILILNSGRADDGIPHETAFLRVRRHSAFRGAVARGAVPVWMPKLDPVVALEIEGKRAHFAEAQDGITRLGSPLGWTARVEVKGWLDRMERAFAPVSSWLV